MHDRCRPKTPCWLFVVALVALMNAPAAGDDSIASGTLATMSWDEIHPAMEAYPPSFENGDERLQIMQSLDRLICYSVKHVNEEDRPKIEPWLTVPEYDSVQRFGPCEILTQFGYQYATTHTGYECGFGNDGSSFHFHRLMILSASIWFMSSRNAWQSSSSQLQYRNALNELSDRYS